MASYSVFSVTMTFAESVMFSVQKFVGVRGVKKDAMGHPLLIKITMHTLIELSVTSPREPGVIRLKIFAVWRRFWYYSQIEKLGYVAKRLICEMSV